MGGEESTDGGVSSGRGHTGSAGGGDAVDEKLAVDLGGTWDGVILAVIEFGSSLSGRAESA